MKPTVDQIIQHIDSTYGEWIKRPGMYALTAQMLIHQFLIVETIRHFATTGFAPLNGDLEFIKYCEAKYGDAHYVSRLIANGSSNDSFPVLVEILREFFDESRRQIA